MMNHFLARGVDVVDAVADDQHIGCIGVVGHRFEHGILEIGNIGEVEATVEADGGHYARGGQLVDLGVVQRAVGHATEDGDARFHGVVEEEHQRQAGADHDALVQMRCCQQGDDKGDEDNHAVDAAGLPCVLDRLGRDQSGDRQHDDDGQHGLGQVVEVGREEQQNHRDEHAVEDRGQPGLGSRLKVDGRTGEGAAGRVGLEEGAADVGNTLADQFLVGVETLLGFGGKRLGHGDGLHESHHGNDERRRQQRQDGVEIQHRQPEGGQSGGDVADHGAAATEFYLAVLDTLDMPVATVGLDARWRRVLRIEHGALLFVGLGAQELHLVDVMHALLVGGFQAGKVQFRQFDPVFQVGRGTGIVKFFRLPQLDGHGRDIGGETADLVGGMGILGHKRSDLRIGDVLRRAFALVLITRQYAHQDGGDHGNQHAGLGQGRNLVQAHHHRQSENGHGQRRPMGLRQEGEHFPHVEQEGIAAALGDAQQHVELRHGDDDGGGIHEAEDHRVRHEVDDGAEFDYSERELDDADHQGEQQRQGDVVIGEGHRERRHGGGGHQGNDGHGAGKKLPRGTPHGAEYGRDKGRIEAEIQRQPRQLCVRHRLGHQYQPAGDAGDQVTAQDDGIDREPGEKGEETQQQLVVGRHGNPRSVAVRWRKSISYDANYSAGIANSNIVFLHQGGVPERFVIFVLHVFMLS